MSKPTTHIHTFDKNRAPSCCSTEQKTQNKTTEEAFETHEHDHDHNHSGWKSYALAGVSFVLLLAGLTMTHLFQATFFTGWVKVVWYIAAYAPVGVPVMIEAWHSLRSGELFTEFFLMCIATIGAFSIGEYPEGVAVMLFYAIGELFQSAAVSRAKNNIRELLDIRPKTAFVLRENGYHEVHPEEVNIGNQIQIRVGENIPLDGVLLSDQAILNMAAITGEGMPVTISTKQEVLARIDKSRSCNRC